MKIPKIFFFIYINELLKKRSELQLIKYKRY